MVLKQNEAINYAEMSPDVKNKKRKAMF